MRKSAIAIVALALALVALPAFGGRAMVYWPGGSKLTAVYDSSDDTIHVTWPAAAGAQYYVACYTVREYGTQCSDNIAPYTQPYVYFTAPVAGAYNISVTAYNDWTGESDALKTRLRVP